MTRLSFKALKTLYASMDKTWDKIATGYHFHCNGCEDNCCKSLFFHHTHIEKAYLIHGFNGLDQDTKEKILIRAKNYCSKTFPKGSEINALKIICPLNEDGLCLLYPFRPMICRLHGLPHELKKPGVEPVKGPGCDAGLFDDKPYIKFDRTPFYQQMAQIEMKFRRDSNKAYKTKQTIAQMLISL
jgi:Fe-S-cluster containining protein